MFTLTATDTHYGSTRIEIHLPGNKVNLVLRNQGATKHGLHVHALGIHIVAEPGATITAGLPRSAARDLSGYCGAERHHLMGMQVNLVVN